MSVQGIYVVPATTHLGEAHGRVIFLKTTGNARFDFTGYGTPVGAVYSRPDDTTATAVVPTVTLNSSLGSVTIDIATADVTTLGVGTHYVNAAIETDTAGEYVMINYELVIMPRAWIESPTVRV